MTAKAIKANINWIILTGMMGVGKSTFGKNLALKMSLPFWDMDEIIEKKTNRKISQLFSNFGEHGFRRWERILFRQTVKNKFGIMACGGGLLCQSVNINYIRKYSKYIDIWLNTADDELIKRVDNDAKDNDKRNRPLLNNNINNSIKVLIKKRRFKYNDALIHIANFGMADSFNSNDSIENSVKILKRLIRQLSIVKNYGKHIKLR